MNQRSKKGLYLFIPLFMVYLFSGYACRSGPAPDYADLILYNATVWTGDTTRPRAEAIAIKGRHILDVGTSVDILRLRNEKTRVIDLKGAFVTPGFIDSHVHMASAGRFHEFNIMKTGTQEEFVERIKETIQHLEPGEWVVGGYWGAYDRWAPGSAGHLSRPPFNPDMRNISDITREHPVLIWKFDGSEYAINETARKIIGFEPDNPPEGVEPIRDENGVWTGRLRGPRVAEYLEPYTRPSFSYHRRLKQTLHALDLIRKAGVTTIHDMSDETQLAIYRDLRSQDLLSVRVHFRYPLDEWDKLARWGIRIGGGDPWIRLGALKGHIDGIMGNKTARFFEPYNDDPTNRGRWRRLMVDENGNFVEGKFLRYMILADQAGLQLSVHAIGDEANHVLLNYLEELIKKNGEKDRRFRLVHAQVIHPDDFPRFRHLRVIAEVQPYHLSDDMRWMEERIGHERCRGAYAFRTLMENGATLSFGSDWPGTSAAEYPINPLLGIYAAVTRQTLKGEPPEGWFPEERISVEEALRAYTVNNAYASFEEDLKGTLTPGKLADITVLDRNILKIPPHKILQTKVLYTIVDGQIVYQSEGD